MEPKVVSEWPLLQPSLLFGVLVEPSGGEIVE